MDRLTDSWVGLTDRRGDKQMGKQKDRQTGRQMHGWDGETEGQTDAYIRWAIRHRERQMGKRQTNSDGQTDKER
jgi:hypothetical protein